jgi:hypothetical protein
MAQTRRLGMRNELAQLADAPRFSPYQRQASQARSGRNRAVSSLSS